MRRRTSAKIVTDHTSAAAMAVGTVAVSSTTVKERSDDPGRASSAGSEERPPFGQSGSRRCDFCGRVPDPDAEVGSGGAGAAPTDTTVRATAQASAARGTLAPGLAGGDRPAVAGGGDPGSAELHPDRWIQAGAGAEAPGARHRARDLLAGPGGRGAAPRSRITASQRAP